jgi:hypothetical protein
MRKLIAVLGSLAALAVGASHAFGASITYSAVDLADSVPGDDLWEYRYSLGAEWAALLAGQGFDIYFAVADGFEFGDLVAPQMSSSPDWDVLAIQADPALPADGLFDAVALVDSPDFTGTFIATFIWRGNGEPGAQYFEVFDEQLNVTESGMTQLASVPEPKTVGVALMAVLATLAVTRRPSRRRA